MSAPTPLTATWFLGVIDGSKVKITVLEVTGSVGGEVKLRQTASKSKAGFGGVAIDSVDLSSVYAAGMDSGIVSNGNNRGYAAFDVEYYVQLNAPPPAFPLPPVPPPTPPMAPMMKLVRSAVTMSTNDPSWYAGGSPPTKCIDDRFDYWANLCQWQASDPAPWISVELSVTSYVTTVEIYTAGGHNNKLKQYQVWIGDMANDPSAVLCAVEFPAVPSDIGPHVARCNGNGVVGRYVTIRLQQPDTERRFREIFVYGYPNLPPPSPPQPSLPTSTALLTPVSASMSTRYSSATSASKCIDGATDPGGSPCHTSCGGTDTNPWISIDLGAHKGVYKVEFVNYNNNHGRLGNYEIWVGHTAGEWGGASGAQRCAQGQVRSSNDNGGLYTHRCEGGYSGRYVTVVKKQSGCLHLIEVQAFGVFAPPTSPPPSPLPPAPPAPPIAPSPPFPPPPSLMRALKATMSNTRWPGGGNAGPEKCIDGDVTTPCESSKADDQWLALDLDTIHAQSIDSVKLYTSRNLASTLGVYEIWAGFRQPSVASSGKLEEQGQTLCAVASIPSSCPTDQPLCRDQLVHRCPPGTLGIFITVFLPGRSREIRLTEVQVFGSGLSPPPPAPPPLPYHPDEIVTLQKDKVRNIATS